MSIDRAAATAIAENYVKELRREADMPDEDDLIILHNVTLETSRGWAFHYCSRIYYETKNPDYMVVGNRPFLVHMEDGAVETLFEQQEPWWRRWFRRSRSI